MYIDKIDVSYNDNTNETYKNDAITEDLLVQLKNFMDKHELHTIVFENSKNSMSLNIFYENNKSFVGIINMYEELFYYYDNGEAPKAHVEIWGNYYDNRFVSHDNNLTYEIFKEFALTGEFYSDVDWIEE